MISFLVAWIGVLGCTVDDGALPDLKEQSEIAPSASTNSSTGELPPPHAQNEPSPAHNSPETTKLVDSLESGSLVFSNFKGCQVDGSVEGDAPKGWFLYAWNDQRTLGLVLSIHQFAPEDLNIGDSRPLSVDDRDAFVMVEIGESVDTNFCVWNIQQIPMATVLESQVGMVNVFRSAEGYGASISGVSLKDQYAERILTLPNIKIPPQLIGQPE